MLNSLIAIRKKHSFATCRQLVPEIAADGALHGRHQRQSRRTWSKAMLFSIPETRFTRAFDLLIGRNHRGNLAVVVAVTAKDGRGAYVLWVPSPYRFYRCTTHDWHN